MGSENYHNEQGDALNTQLVYDRYQAILDSIDEGFCLIEIILNKEGKPVDLVYLETNRIFRQQTGLGDLIGRGLNDKAPGIEQAWIDFFGNVALTGKPDRIEYYVAGIGRWFTSNASRLGGEGSLQVAVLFDDITERKLAQLERAHAEEASRIREALLNGQKQAFQAAVSSQPLAVSLGVLVHTVVKQTEGEARAAFYMVPPGAEGLHHIVGMSEEFAKEVLGFVIGAESLSCGLAMHTGKPVITPDVELESRWKPWLTKARKYDIRSCWSFPVQTDGGPVLGTFAMYFNEPREPKPRELELAGIIAHAAAIIISRHSELLVRTQAEAALRENEQQLKALIKQKDDFIGVASHELKTPVTSIKAYAEVVQEMLDRAGLNQESDILKRLNKQIDRLTLLINDLLDTTKISEGKITYSFEPSDINELLKERIEELARTTTRNLEMHLEELPLVIADKERIGQVVINLITNAIKYSQKDSVVTIKTTPVANGVRVSIKDEGKGIAEEEQKKIFDRFYRITTNNFDTYPGMGLGLYISANIIERHGGRLEVESSPGKGSMFFFTLPFTNGQP